MPTILINGVCLSEYQYICPKKQAKSGLVDLTAYIVLVY